MSNLITRYKSFGLVCAVVATLSAASVPTLATDVVTQVEERSYWSLWLLSTHIQQDVAHQYVWDNHNITVVEVFSDQTLAGAEIVYISPALDELIFTEAEIDALEAFVLAGGRLILPADNSVWADGFRPLAARFGVTYGESWINGVVQVDVLDSNNPILNGPMGAVNNFSGASANDNLSTTNENIRILARWQPGPNSLAYLEHGDGQIVFLSDFNTFDTDMINDHDNFTLWKNLFEAPASSTAALKSVEIATGTLLNGNVADLFDSDDAYVQARSGFGQTLVDLHNMEMIIGATTGVTSPSLLDIKIESRIDESTGLAQIRLRNWSDNQMEQVASYSIGDSDQIDTIEGLDATLFVNSDGGLIELSIKHIVFVPFLAFTFESFVDHVEIRVN